MNFDKQIIIPFDLFHSIFFFYKYIVGVIWLNIFNWKYLSSKDWLIVYQGNQIIYQPYLFLVLISCLVHPKFVLEGRRLKEPLWFAHY
jgi:hypothetical protein